MPFTDDSGRNATTRINLGADGIAQWVCDRGDFFVIVAPNHLIFAMKLAVLKQWPLARWLDWAGRIAALVLLLFWGQFFVAHLSWFADPGNLPPPRVFALQLLHLAFLVGLMLGWRWPLVGSAVLLLAAVPFFWFAAGSRFLPFAAVTSVPAALWVSARLAAARAQ
jgi:hypothetical protein